MGRKTQPKRMQATLLKIKAVLRERMHERVNVVGQWLKRVVEGYYRYHAVPGNTVTLEALPLPALWNPVACRAWLRRRSQRSRPSWKRFRPTFDRWIPRPRVLHPYPDVRFDATHPR